MKDDQPLVSIIIVAMNDEKFIGHAIDSALNQDYPNKEVHVQISDMTRDRTVAIVRGYGISYAVEPDIGVPDGANKGIEKTTGDLVMFLGADDALLPWAVSELAAALRQNPTVTMAYGKGRLIDADGRAYRTFESGPFDLEKMFRLDYVPAQSVMVRRQALLEVGMWRADVMNADWDLWLRIGARTHPIFVPKVLSEYRVHAGSASLNNRERCGWSTRVMADSLARDEAIRSALGGRVAHVHAAMYMIAALWFFRAGRFGAMWKTVRDAVRLSPAVLLTRKTFALLFGMLMGPRLYEKFCTRGAGIQGGSASATA